MRVLKREGLASHGILDRLDLLDTLLCKFLGTDAYEGER